MVERQNEQCRGVVVFCLALGLIEAALQYWNEFKVSVGFVSVSRTPERIKTAAQAGLRSTKDGESSS